MDRPGHDPPPGRPAAGKVKSVVVWRLDRLGRTAKGLTARLDELAALKVTFISLRDGIDLSTPASRLIANVLASVASYETEIRAERIAAGKAAKAAKIEAIIKAEGTPPVNKGGRPRGVPQKVTPTVAGMILQMKTENKKVTMIARELNLSRADRVRSAAAGVKQAALQSSTETTRSGKGWELVPHPAQWTADALVFFMMAVLPNRVGGTSRCCWYRPATPIWDSGGCKNRRQLGLPNYCS